ncbi:MAG: hypothetical protein AB9861_02570 [Methanosarcina sp.]|jgi:hypothetical protein
MAKTISDTPKAGAACGKPQAKAPEPVKSATKGTKADSKPSKGTKK